MLLTQLIISCQEKNQILRNKCKQNSTKSFTPFLQNLLLATIMSTGGCGCIMVENQVQLKKLRIAKFIQKWKKKIFTATAVVLQLWYYHGDQCKSNQLKFRNCGKYFSKQRDIQKFYLKSFILSLAKVLSPYFLKVTFWLAGILIRRDF